MVDWSKHELLISKTENCLIHHLKIPNSSINNVKYINAGGVCSITGDFGNWIFCREFHPSAEGQTSEGYWLEKLRIASCQEPMKFDSDGTRKEILERIEDVEWEYAHEYFEDLLGYTDENEFTYRSYAYENLPSEMDSEDIPFIYKPQIWFTCILEAFDEICKRLKTE